MKKLLLILSSCIFTTTSISNLSNVTYILNNKLQKNFTDQNIVKQQINDSTKLEAWHNSLSIEQDAQAKQAYENAMKITATKSVTGNFDTYNIVFDNAKLQAMLKNKLINQDVYNIWKNVNTSKTLTMEANAIINIKTKNNLSIQEYAFQNTFYIQNNEFYFVDKDHPNPNNNLRFIPSLSMVLFAIMDWFDAGKLNIFELPEILTDFYAKRNSGASEEELEIWLKDYIAEEVNQGALEGFWEWFESVAIEAYNCNLNKSISKYFFLNSLEKYQTQIMNANNKYNTGASETFYFLGLYMDPNSIQSLPPMTKTSEINDEDKASYFNRGKKITNEYDNVPLLDYNGYDSLWQYLNTDGEAFNLNKIFKSYVGVLGKYNNLNYTFHHLEATAILKPYLNTWVTLTKTSWTNNNRETSLAQMQMMISDNPRTKTVEFNFKSILCNINALDSVGNEMFY